MDKKVIKSIILFCKNNETVAKPVAELYKNYIKKEGVCLGISQGQFEFGLLVLKKKVILNLRNKCLDFIKAGLGSYEEFITVNEPITKVFWDYIVGQDFSGIVENHARTLPVVKSTQVLSHKQRVPANWKDMSSLEKAEFFKGIEKDDEFKAYVLALDPNLKKYMESQDNKREPSQNKAAEEVDYKSLLPVNWVSMSFSDRVSFAISIEDTDFKAYVLTQDPKIANYLKYLKSNRNDKSFNLYVTLYSFPADSKSTETKDTLKDFVSALNKLGRSRLQYLEISEPPLVEIREVK